MYRTKLLFLVRRIKRGWSFAMLALPIAGRRREDYHQVLSVHDTSIMDATRQSPEYIEAMASIMGYGKTRLVAAIDSSVVQQFKNCGVTIFGDSVKDAKVLIPRWLEDHPACKDADPIRCFNKILYWLAYEWGLQQQMQQAQITQG